MSVMFVGAHTDNLPDAGSNVMGTCSNIERMM